MRKINAAGLALIKSFEGLELKSYKCPAGVWTVGYGSTGRHVTPGMTITEAQAESLLKKDLRRFELGVERAIGDAPTSDNEFSAFVSLAFNIGVAAFQRSTVLKRHLAGNKAGAADAFMLWVKAGGRTLKGLIRRREAERKLYLTPDAPKPAENPPERPVESAPRPEPPKPATVPAQSSVAPLGCLAVLLGMFRK